FSVLLSVFYGVDNKIHYYLPDAVLICLHDHYIITPLLKAQRNILLPCHIFKRVKNIFYKVMYIKYFVFHGYIAGLKIGNYFKVIHHIGKPVGAFGRFPKKMPQYFRVIRGSIQKG